MRRFALVLALVAAACGRAPDEPPPGGPASAATFSREAFAPRARDAGASEPAVPMAPSDAALEEILAAAPKGSAKPSTGADGGTAIGGETGDREVADAGDATPAADRRKASRVSVGKPEFPASISGPAIEQALRAQVYFRLTQRCRARDRRILPPEVVRVSFHLDADGYVVPSSILASAKDERYAEAARCMARELSTIAFRAPPSGRGSSSIVHADVPSVD